MLSVGFQSVWSFVAAFSLWARKKPIDIRKVYICRKVRETMVFAACRSPPPIVPSEYPTYSALSLAPVGYTDCNIAELHIHVRSFENDHVFICLSFELPFLLIYFPTSLRREERDQVAERHLSRQILTTALSSLLRENKPGSFPGGETNLTTRSSLI